MRQKCNIGNIYSKEIQHNRNVSRKKKRRDMSEEKKTNQCLFR